MSTAKGERAARAERRWLAVSAVAGLAMLTIWATPWAPPSLDLPAHLALTEVARTLGEGHALIDARFAWGTFPAPNSIFYGLTLGLGALMPPMLAGRVVLLMALAVQLLGAVAFTRAMGRTAAVTPILAGLCVTWALTQGLVDYCIGVGLACYAWARLQRLLEGGPSVRGAVAQGGLGVLIFVSHIQALVFYMGGAAALLGLHLVRPTVGGPWRAGGRRAVVAAATLAPPIVAALLWMLDGPAGAHVREVGDVAYPLSARVGKFWVQGFGVYSELPPALIPAVVSLGLAAAAAAAWGAWRRAGAPADGSSAAARARWCFPPLIAVGALVSFFFGPLNIGDYWNFHARSLTLLWLVAPAALCPPLSARDLDRAPGARARIGLPLTLAVGAVLVAQLIAVDAWRRWTAGLEVTLEAAPSDSRLVLVIDHPGESGFHATLWHHLGQYHTVINHGTTAFSFGFHPGRIVREVTPRLAPSHLPGDAVARDPALACAHFEYVLHRGTIDLASAAPGALSVVQQDGAWTLLRCASAGSARGEVEAPGVLRGEVSAGRARRLLAP